MNSDISISGQAESLIEESIVESLKCYQSDQFGSVRVIIRDGDPWFVAKDVCAILGLENVSKACDRLDDDETSNLTKSDVGENTGLYDFSNGGRSPIIVSEPGLYSLVLCSNKPEAKAFKRWITHDVIPSIRKTGKYSLSLPDFSDPAEAAIAWAREYREKQAAIVERDRAIRTKYLFVEGRDAEMCGRVGGLTNANERLREQIGDSTNWKQAKAIPWLRRYFDIRIKGFFGQLGKVLTSISENMGIKTRTVEDTSWGVVKAYHVSVISQLQSLLDAGEDILPKYRKWEQ
jgi:prophage antirepressor-like protein